MCTSSLLEATFLFRGVSHETASIAMLGNICIILNFHVVVLLSKLIDI
jgi:hypothetical protein